jgi:hypothetical protein
MLLLRWYRSNLLPSREFKVPGLNPVTQRASLARGGWQSAFATQYFCAYSHLETPQVPACLPVCCAI